MHFEYVIKTIQNATGWNKPSSLAQGIISFELENDLVLSIHNPGGDHVFLYSELVTLPHNIQNSQELCQKIAMLALGTCKKMRSTVSLKMNVVMLHLDISETNTSNDIIQKAKVFLNELAWWKKQITQIIN